MDLLPSEIVNEILLRVSKPTLYYASKVCSQWSDISLEHVKIIKSANDLLEANAKGDLLSIAKCELDSDWLDQGFEGACKGGYKELVELMIRKGASDWNVGLYYACEAGHKEIVELMIAQGSDIFDLGLYAACGGGHKDIVELMITKGATRCYCRKTMSEH